MPYSATISRDAEAGVWHVSETDFLGLVAEADTQQGLAQKIRSLVLELCDANEHLMRRDRARGEVVIQLSVQQLETIKLAEAPRYP